MGNPGTRRWFCPECGTLWIFAMRIVGRKPVGAWRPASRSADAEIARLRTLLSEITTLADRLETHYRHTPEDPGAVLAAGLIRRTLEDT